MKNQEPDKLNDDVLELKLLDIWRRALKNDQLTIDDDFFECGGDSLLATKVLLEIEQLTDKLMPVSIIFETGTVRHLQKKIKTIEAFRPRKFFFMGPENGEIIHFFHGDFTQEGGFFIKIFSEMLGNKYLIHAIAPHLPHEENLPETIEEMAKDRLPKVLAEQPDGEYILLGRCNGALVAFEAARQLLAMGKKVKSVVMIDPPIISITLFAQFTFKIANTLMSLTGLDGQKRRKHLIWVLSILTFWDSQTKDFHQRVTLFLKKPWLQKQTAIKAWFNFVKNQHLVFEDLENMLNYYGNAFIKYKPLPLDVPLLYVSLEYSGNAWRRVTKDTIYMNIYRGKHVSWNEDYSEDITNKIRDFINQ